MAKQHSGVTTGGKRHGVRILSFLAFLSTLAWTSGQPNYGQVVLENKTGRTLDLSVDGRYGCRAMKNLTCTSQQLAGNHTLTAKGGDFEATDRIELIAGRVCTWVVKEDSTAREGCKAPR